MRINGPTIWIGIGGFALIGAILAAAVFSRVGWVDGDNTPYLSEIQVLEILYGHLMAKGDDQQGAVAAVEKGIIELNFSQKASSAVIEALENHTSTLEASRGSKPTSFPNVGFEKLRDSGFEMQIMIGGLNKFATYSGEGWWLVAVGNLGVWRINEMNGTVEAQDSRAKAFLERVALKTYKNDEYGYEVDYRQSWTVDDGEKRAVLISSPNLVEEFAVVVVDGSDESTAVLPVLSALVDDLPRYIQARVRILEAEYYDFDVTGQSATSLEFLSRNFEGAQQGVTKIHFTQSNGIVYEIWSSTTEDSKLVTALSEWGGYSLLYDASRNFRLNR